MTARLPLGSPIGCPSAPHGYAMVTLLVALSIMAVMVTAAMPVWKQVSRREREAELIFRGEQYARAISLFQRKNGPGSLPASLDQLVAQRFLRKKYKDPITSDDFALVRLSQTAPPGSTQTGRGRGGAVAPAGASQPGVVVLQETSGPGTTSGAISGVVSKSKEKSLRLYKGRNHYNEWQFVFTPPAAAPGTPAPGAPTPGARGAGGQPAAPGQGPAQPLTPPFGPGRRNR
jgi:type II secretory pathway pseudopilin PulG